MKKEYFLHQETPMIHFQSNEEGACLRGTEVKPKLDKFILKRKNNIPLEWYVNREQSNALNYKIRIVAKEEAKIIDFPNSKLYFGNVGKEKKKTVMYVNEDLKLSIVCFIPELLDVIDSYLQEFFLLHNFGTRQNRGFGSFSLVTEENDIETIKKKYEKNIDENLNIYHISYDENTTIEDIFDDIDIFANVLKSGRNIDGIYIKSFLTKYCLEKGIFGEKRFLKQEKLAPIGYTKENYKEYENNYKYPFRYIRALLGAAETYSFINYEKMKDGYKRITKTKIIKDKKTNKEIEKIIDDRIAIRIKGNKDIKRIPSPIMYKIIGNNLFIIVRTPASIVYGAEFKFSSKWNFDNPRIENKTENVKRLQVPNSTEINVQDVVRAYVKDINDKGKYYTRMKEIMKKADSGNEAAVNFIKQSKKIEIIEAGETKHE